MFNNNKFLKDLSNKPYEERHRIFWTIMIIVIVIVIAVWLFLIKNYKQGKGVNDAKLKLPSLNEIIPPEVSNKFKNINNSLNNGISNNNIQPSNNMTDNNIAPFDNSFRSENKYVN